MFFYISGEYIKKKGDVGVGMWLILYGKVNLNRHKAEEHNETISTGKIIGLHLLFKRKHCGHTAIAENYVDIFYLTKESFDEVCSYYPKVRKRLDKRAINYANVDL